ncbi:hypothetical protein XELAEV_18040485mg [Xenopus laevis]|uniref:Ig-like domain-containing protein n=1 Tax=Xenopus laevis TaxID=8355 RepID=A0A974C9P8_XENLA|nr:hypothetical protein XELAEV_18040485mg [Xenopus laevis]
MSVSEKLLLCLLSPALLIVTAQVSPIQVSGLITQSVSLAPTEHLAHPVEEVAWYYASNRIKFRIADFRNQQLSIRHSQFSQRLEVDNSGTRLWIRELRSEDTGSYTAAIVLQEPVPSPDIKMEKVWITPDWCNFTLHCSAPTKSSALSYSWMYRHKERYQPYTNGTTIHVSLQPESWDGEYLCFIHNPADQKNGSITTQAICSDTSLTKGIKDKSCRMKLYIYLPILTALSLSLAALIIVTRTKRQNITSTGYLYSCNQMEKH